MTSKPTRTALRRSGGVIAVGAVIAAMGVPLATSASAADSDVSSISLSPNTQGVTTGSCATITVTTKNSAGAGVANSAPGASVTISEATGTTAPTLAFCAPAAGSENAQTPTGAAGTSGSNTTETATGITTDSSGIATIGVKSNTNGTLTVSGADNGHVSNSVTVNVETQQTGNAAVKTLSVDFPHQTSDVDNNNGSDSFVVTAKDALGVPVSGASVQEQVTGPDSGTADAAPDTFGPPTNVTNGAGQVTFTYAAASPGTDSILYFVNPGGFSTNTPPTSSDAQATATLKIVPAGSAVDTVTVSAPNGKIGSPETITATVTDSDGAVDGSTDSDQVNFQVTGADDVAGMAFVNPAGTTAGEGQATFTFTPGRDGTDQVTATDTSETGNPNASKSFTVGNSGSNGTSRVDEHPTLNCHSPSKHKVHCLVKTSPALKGATVVLRKVENSGGTRIIRTDSSTGHSGHAGFTIGGYKSGRHEHYVAHVRASSVNKGADTNHDGAHVR